MLKKIFSALWKGWMAFAKAIGYVQTRIILFIFYVLILGPVSIFLRLFRVNIMSIEPEKKQSFWQAKAPMDETLEGLQRQF